MPSGVFRQQRHAGRAAWGRQEHACRAPAAAAAGPGAEGGARGQYDPLGGRAVGGRAARDAAAVPRAASWRVASGVGGWWCPCQTRRGQPCPSWRAFSGRIAGIPPPGHRGTAATVRERPHHRVARRCSRNLSCTLPTHHRDEPLPLRPSRRRQSRMQQGPPLRRRLHGRISGPLLDRMDLVVYVQPVPPAELSRAPPGEASDRVASRVRLARERQSERYRGSGARTNAEAEIGAIDLQPDARILAEQASDRLRLSARGFTRVLRVARTAADLANVEQVRRARRGRGARLPAPYPRAAAMTLLCRHHLFLTGGFA